MDPLVELRMVVEELHGGLDRYPYHVFLGVEARTRGDALQAAFHRRAIQFHPDRFYGLDDEALRAKIYAVYKRITEAYRVLSDPELRRRWEEQHKLGASRLDQTGRHKTARPEDSLSEPAKKYYSLAMDAERRGDQASARLNLQLALQFDPDSPFLKEKRDKLR